MNRGPKPFITKICPSCGVEKHRSDYYKKSGDLVSYRCKPCTLSHNESHQHRYKNRYDEYRNEWRRNRYKTSQAFREKIADQKKVRYDKRKEGINELRRARWASDPNHPQKLNPRRGGVSLRTPTWANARKLAAFYVACPDGKEVDHIVPLKGLIDGRPVSGLHVHWNLQYLTPTQNRKKKNRIRESDIPAFVLSDHIRD